MDTLSAEMHAQISREEGLGPGVWMPLSNHKAKGFLGNTGPEVIKLFSCSTQLFRKFQLPIKTKILTNKEISCFNTFTAKRD